MNTERSFRLFPRQLYDGILLLATAYISYNELIACWLNSSCMYASGVADYSLWGATALGAYLILVHDGKRLQLFRVWKENWLVALFILYSAASITWSVAPERSIHAVYVMGASTLIASIFAVIYSPKTIFRILFAFTLLAGVLSLLTIIISPGVGIHTDHIWYGAWRGIFEHKNDLGALMSFGNGLAVLAFASATGKRDKAFIVLCYFFTLFLTMMSRSATGLILWLVLNSLAVIFFAWVKWGAKVRGKSLAYGMGILTGIIGVGALSAFAILKLTGKNLSLTGRVPLWINLLENVISKKPWFGYGLETLWSYPEFRKWASVTSGWGDEIVVVNGHNGYIDILLYLGAAGLLVLVAILARGVIHATTRAFNGRTWLDFFPLLALAYFLIVNISVDYILQFESFHWMLLVVILFLPSGKLTQSDL